MTALAPADSNHGDAEHQELPFTAGEAPSAAPRRNTTKAAGVPSGAAKQATTKRTGNLFRPRRGRAPAWDPDEVATHLMACRTQMVRGLARKSPWAGLDDETLDSCFGHGAAVIARVAASGQRPEWRTPKDLEKAQIAAFRHQALDHWKRVNAQSRQGDRFSVAFDPERHGLDHAPIDRLFEQPDLHTIERDLLAELVDEELRAFWTFVLCDHLSFKEAGARLGLARSEVMANTRAGRTAFGHYLERRSSGELCVERSLDITADRAGHATPLRTERARAHLESCYACALVHEPTTSAVQRGILGLAPTGFILRLLARAGDMTASPAMRLADTGTGSRAVAAGVAAIAVAGSGIGIEAATDAPPKTKKPSAPAVVAPGVAPAAPPRVDPAKLAPRLGQASPPRRTRSTRRSATRAGDASRSRRPERAKRPTGGRGQQSVPPEQAEFSFERGARAAPPTPPSASSAPTPQGAENPAVTEFQIP